MVVGKHARPAQGRRAGRARQAESRSERAVLASARLHRPMDDPYRHLLHCENGSSVESAWVGGRPAVEDGRTVVEDALIAEAEEMSAPPGVAGSRGQDRGAIPCLWQRDSRAVGGG